MVADSYPGEQSWTLADGVELGSGNGASAITFGLAPVVLTLLLVTMMRLPTLL